MNSAPTNSQAQLASAPASGGSDSLMAEISANQEYENELKKQIEDSTPYVSDLIDLGVLKVEYHDNKFEACFDSLYTRYQSVRRLRRDGNCFYRAFLFQLFEFFVQTKDKEYASFLSVAEASKDDLVANGGYDLIAIEDFHEVFVDALKALKGVAPANAAAHCIKVLCNN